MVVKVQAISSQTSQDIARTFMERAAELRAAVAARIADDIVDFSPVDTGTYVLAHVATTSPDSEAGTRTSRGKARNREAGQFRNLARGNLKRSVSKEAILNSPAVFFANRAEHAERVEWLGWSDKGGREAYHVYAQAKARVAEHIAAAAREMGLSAR